MSGKLVMQVWHADDGDASTILVLMALADEANDAGECSVDLATVAKKARQRERNCQYILRRLENVGLIERFESRGRGHKNRYQLHLEHLQNLQRVHVLPERQILDLSRGKKVQKVQPVQVLEKVQKVQPVQVFTPIKGAKGATSAGFTSPLSPSDSPLLPLTTGEKEKENSPYGGAKEREKPPPRKVAYSEGFEEHFWKPWHPMRRAAKPKCFALWKREGLEHRAHEIGAIVRHLHATVWLDKDPQFIPLTLTWLNQGRYDDGMPTPAPSTGSRPFKVVL